jgi:hypothetical protein
MTQPLYQCHKCFQLASDGMVADQVCRRVLLIENCGFLNDGWYTKVPNITDELNEDFRKYTYALLEM